MNIIIFKRNIQLANQKIDLDNLYWIYERELLKSERFCKKKSEKKTRSRILFKGIKVKGRNIKLVYLINCKIDRLLFLATINGLFCQD